MISEATIRELEDRHPKAFAKVRRELAEMLEDAEELVCNGTTYADHSHMPVDVIDRLNSPKQGTVPDEMCRARDILFRARFGMNRHGYGRLTKPDRTDATAWLHKCK